MLKPGSAGGRWLMGAFSVFAVSAILLTVASYVPHIRSKALDAECKQNLHSVQLAVERFAVDSPGNIYPLWLCGGSAPRGAKYRIDERLAGDELISEGYLSHYPKNPFAVADRRMAPQLSRLQELIADPYGPQSNFGRQAPVWRFGKDWSLMGCVSVEPMVNSNEHNRELDNYSGLRTPSAIRYPYASGELDSDNGRWLQGQFRYHPRCAEPEMFTLTGGSPASLQKRDAANYEATGYTLRGFGSVRLLGRRR